MSPQWWADLRYAANTMAAQAARPRYGAFDSRPGRFFNNVNDMLAHEDGPVTAAQYSLRRVSHSFLSRQSFLSVVARFKRSIPSDDVEGGRSDA
jgi:hypothetical protein